jgi:hypothetical protein
MTSETPFAAAGFIVTPPLLDWRDWPDAHMPMIAGAGTRGLLAHAWCAQLAAQLGRHARIAPHLAPDPVAVQCTYFEKSAQQNWLVPLHQDLSIPVRERITHAQLGAWSHKEGQLFVQPPASVLEQLVAVRLHVDDCTADDGPLRVVPGSHRNGCLSPAQALLERERCGELCCPVGSGAALLMKPLLLHASSKATGNSRRRVLHFVFGPRALPFGLTWQHAVSASMNKKN